MWALRSPTVGRIFSNTSWLAGEKIVTMGVSLALSIFLARALGTEAWGRLNYLLAVVALIGPFTSLGLNSIVTREIVNQPTQVDKIVVTALVYRVLGSIAGATVCAFVYYSFIGEEAEEIALILALLVSSIFSASQVTEFWFQAQMLNKYVSSLRVTLFLFFALLKTLLVFNDASFEALIMAFCAELVITGCGYLFLYSAKNQSLRLSCLDWRYGWGLLRQSMWLVLSGLAAVLYLKIDQIMLSKLVSNEAVGIYSVAVKLSEVWFFFPAAFAAAIFPVLLRSKAQSESRYMRQLQVSCDALLYSSLLVAVMVIWLAPILVPLLFGSDYHASAAVLTIHIWGGTFVFMRALVSKWLISESLLQFSLWSHGVGALVNLVLNIILIPDYGYWGAAWATVIAYFFSGYLCFWVFPQTRMVARIMTRSILLPVNWHKSYRSNST